MAAPSIGMPIPNHVEDESKLEGRDYIRWDDSRVQSKPEGEDEDIKAVAEMINAIQKAQYNSHRHCYTGRSFRAVDSIAELTGSRHACKDSRHRQRDVEDRTESASSSQAEHVCRRKRMVCPVQIQQ
jgi:hypothetical protein